MDSTRWGVEKDGRIAAAHHQVVGSGGIVETRRIEGVGDVHAVDEKIVFVGLGTEDGNPGRGDFSQSTAGLTFVAELHLGHALEGLGDGTGGGGHHLQFPAGHGVFVRTDARRLHHHRLDPVARPFPFLGIAETRLVRGKKRRRHTAVGRPGRPRQATGSQQKYQNEKTLHPNHPWSDTLLQRLTEY